MSFGGRARTRALVLQRAAWVAGALVVLALIFLLTGHWILGIIFGALAAAGIWLFLQARTVR